MVEFEGKILHLQFGISFLDFFNKKMLCFDICEICTIHGLECLFSAPEPKAQVHYCDHALSVVRRPSVRRPSVRRR